MINFRRATAGDKEIFDEYRERKVRYSENSFVTLYLWDKYYNIHIAEDEERLFLRFTINGKNEYLVPKGKGELKSACEKIAAEEDGDVVFRFVTEDEKELLENIFPGRISFEPREDLYDYVYETAKLISLSGKKLHAKKNHVNYFEKTFDYKYEKVETDEEIKECGELFLKWVDEKTKNINPVEHDAMEKLFDNYRLFGMRGAKITVGGEIVAMTFGERLTEDTVLIQAEKAREDVRGAYPMINKLFLQNEWADTTFVNREEDMGIEGLRQAKESYCPIFKTVKYRAILRKGE